MKQGKPQNPREAPAQAHTVEIAPESWWTVQQTAEYLQLNYSTIYSMTRERCAHPLPAFHCGKQLRFKKSLIDRWMESRANAAARREIR